MKKRVLSLVLAAAMAASLTACGGSEGAEQTSAEAGKTEAADAGSGEQAAADGSVWKIGAMGPLTGPNAIYGNAVVNGAQVAVDEINAAGGINGYQIEYKGEDDESDAEKSINAYNSLKDWGMQVLVGATTSNSCIAVAAKSAQDNLFQITPSGSAVECAENPNVFRVCFSDPDQGAASAKYIGEHKLATKIAVIYDSSDVYSSGIYEKFAQEYKKMNEKLGLKQYLVPYLMSSHPGSTLKEAVELAEHLRDLGYMPEQVQDFYPTPSTISTCMYYTGLDPRTMEPVYVPTNPHEKAMQRALIQYRNPDNYDLVKEALIKAGREDLIGFDQKCLIKPRKMAKDMAGGGHSGHSGKAASGRGGSARRDGERHGGNNVRAASRSEKSRNDSRFASQAGKTRNDSRQTVSGRAKGMAGQTGGRKPKPRPQQGRNRK